MNISAQIESILFWKGEPVSIKKLAAILKKPESEIIEGVSSLKENLINRGVTLIQNEDEVMLGTSKEASTIIESLTKDELMSDLGKAGLETLSIILYRGPVARRDIDYIRGVNSQFILRNLLIRGLIEKIVSPDDQRIFLYKPTINLLAHLGLNSLNELPSYDEMRKEIMIEEKTNGSENE